MTTSEIVGMVQELNFELQDQNEKFVNEFGPVFEYSSIGFQEQIKFLDCILWDSENDERDEEKNGDYEPLEPFIRKKANEVIAEVGKLKF